MPYRPPRWYMPVRQALGSALLDAGAAEEAARVFREDLLAFPENGWSLTGLAQALSAQGEVSEADDVARRRDQVWAHATLGSPVASY